MENSQRSFEYTPDQLDRLKTGLSLERFSTYLKMTGGDEKRAIRRYEHNTALSEAMYGVLQGFEIVLRNAMHDTMARETGHSDWYDHLALDAPELDSIAKAKDKISRKGRTVTVPYVVSELTFGFWSSLTGRNYSATLWIPYLNKAFPHKKLGHAAAFSRLDRVRFLRNKIAHHECVLGRDLEQDYIDIIEATSWICPDTAMWIRHTTRFEAAYRIIMGKPIDAAKIKITPPVSPSASPPPSQSPVAAQPSSQSPSPHVQPSLPASPVRPSHAKSPIR